MLRELLTRPYIQFVDACEDWDEALALVAHPLLAANKITESYVETIRADIQAGKSDYIVLREGFALAHARPEDGVNAVGMSLVKVDQPVYFRNNRTIPLHVILMLAAVDAKQHLSALSSLITCIASDEDFARVVAMREPEAFMAFIAERQH